MIYKAFCNLLRDIIDRIEGGNCNMSEEEMLGLMEQIFSIDTNNGMMNRTTASEFLHMSLRTFDRLVKEGRITKGQHVRGSKELFWSKKDLERVKKLL